MIIPEASAIPNECIEGSRIQATPAKLKTKSAAETTHFTDPWRY
jgi:hypothetical protein